MMTVAAMTVLAPMRVLAPMIVLAAMVSLLLENALQAFQILLQIGAGTGLIFLLRWFWWRINAWSEIAAMVISFIVAVYFQFVHQRLGFAAMSPSTTLIVGVGITTAVWITVTMLTPPTPTATLQAFYDKIRPLGPGWHHAVQTQPSDGGESLTAAFLCWFLGCLVVYAALFGTGFVVYGQMLPGLVCLVLVAASGYGLFKTMPRVGFLE